MPLQRNRDRRRSTWAVVTPAAWAYPATGTSFAFLKNGLQMDMLSDAVNVLPLSDLAAALS